MTEAIIVAIITVKVTRSADGKNGTWELVK